MIVACKKWHVAKRLVAAIRERTNIPALEFVFNEDVTDMPHLGGIESTLEKRTRHRRALIRMLFDHYDSDRMVICLDPTNFDLMQDLLEDRATVKLLELACQFSDAFLEGHAKRVGLAAEDSPSETLEVLLPTIRNDVAYESERMRDADFAHFERMLEQGSLEENAAALARFLSVDLDVARALAETPYLFVD